jgi:hypothetical protein
MLASCLADGDGNAELSNANKSFANHRVTGDPPCSSRHAWPGRPCGLGCCHTGGIGQMRRMTGVWEEGGGGKGGEGGQMKRMSGAARACLSVSLQPPSLSAHPPFHLSVCLRAGVSASDRAGRAV